MPRIHTGQNLTTGELITLDSVAARHVQVLRMQPGDALTLFNGLGGEFDARVSQMGRSEVRVEIGVHLNKEREAGRQVHLAVGMPANERMDWLIEKATELGAASIQPLITERTVLRLAGERAERKTAHWQAAAVAACEQCGRNRIPTVFTPVAYPKWLLSYLGSQNSPAHSTASESASRAILSLSTNATTATEWARVHANSPLLCLSGPEGGLSPQEEKLAFEAGFTPITLGARTLRSETAPLAALALWTLDK